MIQIINSKTNAKIKKVCYLRTNKGRQESGMFVAEGFKALELAIKSHLVVDVFTLKEIKDLDSEINQYIVTEEIINKISSSVNPEGLVFTAKTPTYSLKNTDNRIVYLDEIQDPGNMGTIIRTALAFGYDAVVASPNSVSFYNEKVVAASKGSIFLMPILNADLEGIKGDRKVIVSSLGENSKNLDDIKKIDRLVLVLGNEAHGVKEKTLQQADIICKIPISDIDSINVAVAGAILMYHFK